MHYCYYPINALCARFLRSGGGPRGPGQGARTDPALDTGPALGKHLEGERGRRHLPALPERPGAGGVPAILAAGGRQRGPAGAGSAVPALVVAVAAAAAVGRPAPGRLA